VCEKLNYVSVPSFPPNAAYIVDKVFIWASGLSRTLY